MAQVLFDIFAGFGDLPGRTTSRQGRDMQWVKSPELLARTYFRGRGVPTVRNRRPCMWFPDTHGRTKIKKTGICAVCEKERQDRARIRINAMGRALPSDVAARAYVAQRRKDRLAKSGSTGIPVDLTELLS